MKPLVAAVGVLVALIGEGLEMTGVRKMSARARVAGVAAVSVLLMAGLVWAAQGRTLKVTVNYTGSGEVSATNAIHLSVFDTHTIGQATVPIAKVIATANGETVTVENVTASTVYLGAEYDEKGGWDGQGSSPSGSPAATYMPGAWPPTGVQLEPGQAVEIEFSFDDAYRMP